MTKKEAVRQTKQETTLLELGFTRAEAEALRRISMTLHRWFEHECNGTIQREGKDGDGKPFWHWSENWQRGGKPEPVPVPDRETGARKRLARIIAARNVRTAGADSTDAAYPCGTRLFVSAYIQTDPRGAALYILRPGDVPAGKDVNAYYNHGICVY
jgi:hypothetical protein